MRPVNVLEAHAHPATSAQEDVAVAVLAEGAPLGDRKLLRDTAERDREAHHAVVVFVHRRSHQRGVCGFLPRDLWVRAQKCFYELFRSIGKHLSSSSDPLGCLGVDCPTFRRESYDPCRKCSLIGRNPTAAALSCSRRVGWVKDMDPVSPLEAVACFGISGWER